MKKRIIDYVMLFLVIVFFSVIAVVEFKKSGNNCIKRENIFVVSKNESFTQSKDNDKDEWRNNFKVIE